jgi:hypothetical protein
VKINLGSGGYLLSGYVNVDCGFDLTDTKTEGHPYYGATIEEGAEYVKADMRKLPFPDGSAEYMLSCCSLEHIPWRDIVPTLTEWRRVLADDGELYITVPDFDSFAVRWTTLSKQKEMDPKEFFEILQGVYGSQVVPGEFHCSMFNPQLMNVWLSQAGFAWWKMQVYPYQHPMVYPTGYIPGSAEGKMFRYGMIYIQAYKKGRGE